MEEEESEVYTDEYLRGYADGAEAVSFERIVSLLLMLVCTVFVLALGGVAIVANPICPMLLDNPAESRCRGPVAMILLFFAVALVVAPYAIGGALHVIGHYQTAEFVRSHRAHGEPLLQ